MRNFILWDGVQEIRGVSTDFPHKLPPLGPGQTWVEISESTTTHTCDAGGATIPRPRTLVVEQADRWNAAKIYRDSRIGGGCATPSGHVQTDAASRAVIDSLVLMATTLGASFSEEFQLTDNTVVALDSAAMIALGTAVHLFVSGCHAAGRTVRTAIWSAGTLTELDAVDITASYPS